MIGTLISIVFALIVLGVIWWAIQALLPLIPLPEPFRQIIYVLMVVILVLIVLWVIATLLGAAGVHVWSLGLKMKKFIVILLICIAGPAWGQAPTQVWGLYGWGDNWRGTSSGIDEIAAEVRSIPGVEFVHIFNYWQTQEVADQVIAAPEGTKIAIYGYSCGNNALPVIAKGLNGHRVVDTLAGIQMSLWCGGDDVSPNVIYAQTTYGKCAQTLGLGCKKFRAASGNDVSQILNISRPERHGTADNDPDYQMDVISAIQETAMAAPPTAPGSDVMLSFGHGHALARRGFANMIKGAAMFKRGAHEVVCHHDPSGDQCQLVGE